MKQAIILDSTAKAILVTEIQNYYRSFGSMNKNDFEVLLLHVFLNNSNHRYSNFDISRILGLPESKVKRLRYEADLRYNQVSEYEYQEDKINQLNALLSNAVIKKDGQHIEFVVEDISLRCFLDNILKKKNRFSDSSFNSEVVKIDIKDLEILLDCSIAYKKQRKEIIKEAENLFKKKVEFAELLPALLELAANSTGLITGTTIPGLVGLVKSGSQIVMKLIKK